jgi:outer membrane protein
MPPGRFPASALCANGSADVPGTLCATCLESLLAESSPVRKSLLWSASLWGALAMVAPSSVRAQAPAAANANAAPQKIAVLDTERVFLESEQFKKLRDELVELKKSKQQKLEQLQQQKAALVSDVREQQLDFDSAEMVSKEEELIKLETSAKTYAAVAKQQVLRRELEIQSEMFQVVQKALDKFAETNGYSMVLNAHKLDESVENPNELTRTMLQTVTWHRNREDITDAVIQYLNQRYTAGENVQPASGTGTAKPKATQAEGTRPAATKPATGAAGKPAAGTAPRPANAPAAGTGAAAPRKPTK